jgi:hypothetical protein
MQHTHNQSQALLFLCHLTDQGFIDHFQTLSNSFRYYGDAYFVYDVTRKELPDELENINHFTFSLDSMRRLGYTWMHDSLMPGHVHYPVLEFAQKYPNYSHYWVIEYDVRFTGPWRLFFWLAYKKNADFIASHIYKYDEQPFWHWWSTYRCENSIKDNSSLIRFFGPLYRISRPAIELIDSKLKYGCSGHQEVVLPTLLSNAGFRLLDLSNSSGFESFTNWSWYTRDNKDKWGGLDNSSMRFRPPLSTSGSRPLTFYHPVKTQPHKTSMLSTFINRIINYHGKKQ